MGRQWAHRWRATQGAVFGKLRTEEDITVEEKRLKVGPPLNVILKSCFRGGPGCMAEPLAAMLVCRPMGSKLRAKWGPLPGRNLGPACDKTLRFLDDAGLKTRPSRGRCFSVPPEQKLVTHPPFS